MDLSHGDVPDHAEPIPVSAVWEKVMVGKKRGATRTGVEKEGCKKKKKNEKSCGDGGCNEVATADGISPGGDECDEVLSEEIPSYDLVFQGF